MPLSSSDKDSKKKMRPSLTRPLRSLAIAIAISSIVSQVACAVPYSDEVLQHLEAGKAFLDRNDYENAKTELSAAIKADPNCTDALNNLGVVFLRTQALDKAKSLFEQALHLEPHFAPSLSNLAEIYYLQNDPDDAILLYKEALAYSRDKGYEVETNLANVLRDRGSFAEAANYYKQAIKSNPKYARAHSGYAKVLLQTRNFPEARKQAVQAINLKPDYALAYFHLGLIELAMDRSVDAVKALTISLEYEQNTQYANETRELIQKLNVSPSEITKDSLYQYRLSLRPATPPPEEHVVPPKPEFLEKAAVTATSGQSPTATLERANSLMSKGQWSQARKELKAIPHGETDPVVLNDIGLTFAAERQYDAALPYYKRAITSSKGSCYNALYNLGQVYRMKGNLTLAASTFQDAIKMARQEGKTCPLAQNALGMTLKGKGDNRGAEEAYRLAILQAGMELPVLHYNYAILLEKTDRTRDAVQEYKLYLQMAPQGLNVKQAKARLKRLGVDS
jgi:tetratricopeptide (TPR) repeat protein